MLAGTFAKNIKKLNPKLRIYCGNDDRKPAGLFLIKDGEYKQVCGVDKNDIPEYPIFSEDGHLIKSGWKRILSILVHSKLVNKTKALRLFETGSLYIPKQINTKDSNMFNHIDPNEPLTSNDVFDLATKYGK